MKLLIIADDFTGALDTGIQFSKRGIPVHVSMANDFGLHQAYDNTYNDHPKDRGATALEIHQAYDNTYNDHPKDRGATALEIHQAFDNTCNNDPKNRGATAPNLQQTCDNTEVMVVNTESRHIHPDDAYRIVYKIVKEALDMGVEFIYKKTDSTLRGNIGSELTAVMDAAGIQTMMFIPAYPEMNRTTENGFQYVDGVPLHQTTFAIDILNPIKQSYIPDIIRQQSCIAVKVLRSPDEPYELTQADKQIYLFDAKTGNDMERIGENLRRTNHLGFSAGCAGFADVLPKMIPFTTYPTSIPEFGSMALIVSGSLNEKSMKQLLYGIDRGYPAMTLTPKQKLDRAYWHCSEGNAIIESIRLAYQTHSLFIVRTAGNKQDMEETDNYERNEDLMETANIPSRIAENTGMLVKKVLEAVEISVLVVFGGDTAMGIIEAIGCRSIIPKGEVQPGVAVSQISFDNKRLWMVTKAGGFGSDDVLGVIEGTLKEV